MNKKLKIAGITSLIAWFLGVVIWYLHRSNFAILDPRGVIAVKERSLMLITVLLGLIVIIPVYIMLFLFAWRYREGNKKAKYQPDLSGNTRAELVWWGIPTAIILVLSIITWQTSHSLDPHKPLNSARKPLQIQVVALDWKWLFIYPEQHVASLNYVQFPVDTPVAFSITADAPMNSFWIPQLGSQIYAMPGMSTRLHLQANHTGDFAGSSANLSGKGFSDMRFIAHVSTANEYQNWLMLAKASPSVLTNDVYNKLAKPSVTGPMTLYSGVENDLFQKIVLKYMAPEQS